LKTQLPNQDLDPAFRSPHSANKIISVPFNSQKQIPIMQVMMIVKSTPNAHFVIVSIFKLLNKFLV